MHFALVTSDVCRLSQTFEGLVVGQHKHLSTARDRTSSFVPGVLDKTTGSLHDLFSRNVKQSAPHYGNIVMGEEN